MLDFLVEIVESNSFEEWFSHSSVLMEHGLQGVSLESRVHQTELEELRYKLFYIHGLEVQFDNAFRELNLSDV